MLVEAFPEDAALSLAKFHGQEKPEITAVAAHALLGYAAASILADRAHADLDPADDVGAGDAMEDQPRKKSRRKKADESRFSASDPAPMLEALAAHAKTRLKKGGAGLAEDEASNVPPRVLAAYCIEVLKGDLGL